MRLDFDMRNKSDGSGKRSIRHVRIRLLTNKSGLNLRKRCVFTSDTSVVRTLAALRLFLLFFHTLNSVFDSSSLTKLFVWNVQWRPTPGGWMCNWWGRSSRSVWRNVGRVFVSRYVWLALKILHRRLEKLWQECGRFFVQTTPPTASVLNQQAGSVALFGFIVN